MFGFTLSWNVLIPGQLAPIGLLVLFLLWPFFEAWVTGDKREHHLLQRPRNAPTRTAFLVAMVTLYGLLWIGGGNDVIAVLFNLNLNHITYFLRAAVFVLPVLAFILTRRWCISLQRHDEEKLLHGYETGIIMRSPDGEYAERHLPISQTRAYNLTAREHDPIHELEVADETDGIPSPGTRVQRIRAALSQAMFAGNVQKPTREDYEAAQHHLAHDHEVEAAMEGHSADGHQFDGRHQVEGEELRSH
jgi:ubiquinol-cytochrome c reductase cytochrome b subunit